MGDRFDYESAREHLWDAGLDPDDLPEKNPERRDAYLQKNGINPDQFKPYNRRDQSGSSSGPASSGCFLTSACVQAKNLPNDCDELETLRAFRDSFMMATEQGRNEVQHYYEIAPVIVRAINNMSNSKDIWSKLYTDIVKPAVTLIEQNDLTAAYQLYRSCVLCLQTRFVQPE